MIAKGSGRFLPLTILIFALLIQFGAALWLVKYLVVRVDAEVQPLVWEVSAVVVITAVFSSFGFYGLTHSLLRQMDEKLYRQDRERSQTEKALQEAERRYQNIYENSVLGIFQSTLEGHYITVNPALAKLYGYASPDELIATVTDISQIYVQPKRRAEINAYMQLFEVESDFESEVYRKDGSTIWISENVRAVRDSEGHLLYFEGTVQDITERRQMERELRQQRLRAERLLLNIMPQTVAERLKRGELTIASRFDEVTVMFADLVDFTQLSSRISATDLVKLLGQIFSEFDQLVERYGLEKIKTIGDAYMVAGGLPVAKPNHAIAVAEMALNMQQAIAHLSSGTGEPFQLRIGINSGSIVAGVIGTKRFSYDLWGDTVNVAYRMESQGLPGKIQVTSATYELLKDKFLLERRGTLCVKGKGEMVTYWLVGRKNPQTN
jgi:PAS domain S-box-containing protein